MEIEARFRADCERLTGGIGPDNRLGLAVSGGPDSLALLLLAQHAFPGNIAAATVDHGLRAEAADEARVVAEICTERGIPHTILKPGQPISGNIQAAARQIRYKLLEGWRAVEGLSYVATAHHADDQLETLMMRLLRGSGIDGLASIRPANGTIVRPLLGFRKAELEVYVADNGVAANHDPSNEDRAFDRVRLRRLLEDFPDFEPARLDRSIASAREASEALEWIVQREAETVVETGGGTVALTRVDYPAELLRRLVLHCLRRLDAEIAPRGPALAQAIDALHRRETGTIGAIKYETDDSRGPPIWRFSPAPPRKTG